MLPVEMDRTTLEGFLARFRRNYRAMLAYRPGRYDGRVLSLRARHGGASADVARAWRALAPRAEIIDVDGDHYGITRRERAPAIAEVIGARLRTARSEAAHPSAGAQLPGLAVDVGASL